MDIDKEATMPVDHDHPLDGPHPTD